MPDYLQRWSWRYFAQHNQALATALAIVLALMLFYGIYQLVFLILRNRIRRDNFFLFEALRRHTYAPGLWVFFGLGLVAATPLLPIPVQWGNAINRFLYIYQIFCVSWLLIRILTAFRDFVTHRYSTQGALVDGVRARTLFTQYRIFERIATVFIVILGVIGALITFEEVRQLGVSLLASAGVLGIIVGFAAQRSIATVLAGIQLAVSQPIRLGDTVVIENEWGIVEEITLTYVVIKLWDDRRLIVPINYFIEKPFTNWSRNSSEILGPVMLLADYATPVSDLRVAFYDFVSKSQYWDKRRAVMHVVGVTDRVMELRMTVSAQNAEALFELRCEVREKMIAFMAARYNELLPRGRVVSMDPPKDSGVSEQNEEPQQPTVR
jgi:small-conductance mechanosensitive channel